MNNYSEKVLGKLPPHKEEWITDDTWNMIEARRGVKNAKDDIEISLYRGLSRACTTALRKDFRRNVENLACEAESAANMRDVRRFYAITRKLAGLNSTKQVPMRDKQGMLLTTAARTFRGNPQLRLYHDSGCTNTQFGGNGVV